MGGSTFLIGLIPSYASIGYTAPILVLILRLIQGLALGGEYGGAATYVAEHAPVGKRHHTTKTFPRNMVEAFVGPAQRMWCQQNVFHF